MIDYAQNTDAMKFIIVTETGMLEMLKREVPEKEFCTVSPGSTCTNMKKNSLELVLESLDKEKHIITTPKEIRLRAKKALDKMLK